MRFRFCCLSTEFALDKFSLNLFKILFVSCKSSFSSLRNDSLLFQMSVFVIFWAFVITLRRFKDELFFHFYSLITPIKYLIYLPITYMLTKTKIFEKFNSISSPSRLDSMNNRQLSKYFSPLPTLFYKKMCIIAKFCIKTRFSEEQ